ncbi:MAG: GTP 3',8-cyclase MoaA [Candidatus Marinimicrobia bacterium]|nr:GTP 3',8-cyclase MoaA [Candidatus Neomarinimicrobiota bacterium]
METTHNYITPLPDQAEMPLRAPVVDQFGRTFTYLRIAVNETCNLRCLYCMPEDGIGCCHSPKSLTHTQISHLISSAAELGVTKIRFTGGEPLLHPQIIQIIKSAAEIPRIESVHLTTNGVLLKGKIKQLRNAGLGGLNISLDTLDADRYFQLTRRKVYSKVMEGIEIALSKQIPIKINTVILRGFNHDEIGQFVELTKNNYLTVRFIELMPFDSHQVWKTGKFMSAEHIRELLFSQYPELIKVDGTSTEHEIFQVPGYKGKVAIIPAYSRSLCKNCNRIRVTADGKIRNCLFSRDETEISPEMLMGKSSDDLKKLIQGAMWKKPIDGWEATKMQGENRDSMAQIGG